MDRNLVIQMENVAKNTRKKDLRVGEKAMVKMFGNISFRHSSRDRKLAKTHGGIVSKAKENNGSSQEK